MTKKQSIDYLKDLWNEVYNEDSDGHNYAIALDMAIEALQNTPICCKDCVFSTPDYPLRIFPNRIQAQARQYSCEHSTYSHDADFFCAYGEKRKDYREFNF